MQITVFCAACFIGLNIMSGSVNISQPLLLNNITNNDYGIIENHHTDTCILKEVEIIDSTLLFLVEQIVENDQKCPYYDDKNNFISINIYGVKDSLGNVIDEEYKIQISIWDKSILLGPRDNFNHYFFKFRNFYGIIRARVNPPDNWFKTTGQSAAFDYSNDIPSMHDDSHSLYEYWFMNQKFYIGYHFDCQ